MNITRWVACLAWLALSACQASLPQRPASPIYLGGRGASVVVTPRVAAGPRLLALPSNYTESSIQRLVLKLFRLDGGSEVLAASSALTDPDDFDKAVTFASLRQNTTYRARAYAYKSTDESELISDDANSYTDISVTTNDRPTLVSLQVKLIDVVVSSQGHSTGLTVVDGGYAPVGAEQVTVE